jgi:hypothetical protein
MTIYVPFQPYPSAPFTFSAQLDNGVSYNIAILWNYEAQRWYFNLYDQNQDQILCRALIASPPAYNISLTAGYFTTTIIFRDTTQQFEIG